MATSRRALLQRAGGVALFATLPRLAFAHAGTRVLFVGGRSDKAGQRHQAAVVDSSGATLAQIALPERAHGAAVRDGDPIAVLPARRPGRTAYVIDLHAGQLVSVMRAPAGRHFYGHAAFSSDGRIMFTTENDYETGDGIIGVWETAKWRRVTEFTSGGTGPHELALHADGRTLVVANGGIRTHPETGRTKHNIPTMSPSLAYIDSETGALREQHRLAPALRKLSMRHLAIGADRHVTTVMQYQGSRTDVVPLIASHRPPAPLQPFDAQPDTVRRMRQYCGSVCLDVSSTVLAVTHPRGNMVSFWDATDRRFLGGVSIDDCSAVAPAAQANQFIFATGRGGFALYTIADDTLRWLTKPDADAWRWDNHIVAVRL